MKNTFDIADSQDGDRPTNGLVRPIEQPFGEPGDPEAAWSIALDREHLRATVQMAQLRAERLGHAALASFTQSIAWHDPIALLQGLRLADLGAVLYWERPAQRTLLVGAGVTATIESRGMTRFHDTHLHWQTLLQHAVVYDGERQKHAAQDAMGGPLLFGGFAFDPLRPATELWRDFPDGLLVLPRLLLRHNEDNATLTLNLLVAPAEDVDATVESSS